MSASIQINGQKFEGYAWDATQLRVFLSDTENGPQSGTLVARKPGSGSSSAGVTVDTWDDQIIGIEATGHEGKWVTGVEVRNSTGTKSSIYPVSPNQQMPGAAPVGYLSVSYSEETDILTIYGDEGAFDNGVSLSLSGEKPIGTGGWSSFIASYDWTDVQSDTAALNGASAFFGVQDGAKILSATAEDGDMAVIGEWEGEVVIPASVTSATFDCNNNRLTIEYDSPLDAALDLTDMYASSDTWGTWYGADSGAVYTDDVNGIVVDNFRPSGVEDFDPMTVDYVNFYNNDGIAIVLRGPLLIDCTPASSIDSVTFYDNDPAAPSMQILGSGLPSPYAARVHHENGYNDFFAVDFDVNESYEISTYVGLIQGKTATLVELIDSGENVLVSSGVISEEVPAWTEPPEIYNVYASDNSPDPRTITVEGMDIGGAGQLAIFSGGWTTLNTINSSSNTEVVFEIDAGVLPSGGTVTQVALGGPGGEPNIANASGLSVEVPAQP